MPVKLLSVVLFRAPVPTSQGTDPWHDAFGPFCLPSFPLSALESGTSSPLAPVALTASGLPSRKPRPSSASPMLTTHHLHLATRAQDEDDALSIADSVDSEMSAPSSPGGSNLASSSRSRKALTLKRPSIEPTEFAITSIPILASVTCNQDLLIDACIHRHWAGVVCTSQRAVQAWAEALTSIAHAAVRDYEQLDFERRPNELRLPKMSTTWTRTPFFAVGPATSTALKKIVIGPPAGSKISPTAVAAATSPIRPKVVLGGKSTGNADMLGRFIINFFDCQPGDGGSEDEQASQSQSVSDADPQQYALPHPLLVLQGDKALQILPRMLATAKPSPIQFETMRVYETGVDPYFGSHVDSLRAMLRRARGIALSRRNSGRSSRKPSGTWGTTSTDAVAGPRRGSTSSLSMQPINAGGGPIAGFSTIKDPAREPSHSRRSSFNTEASSIPEEPPETQEEELKGHSQSTASAQSQDASTSTSASASPSSDDTVRSTVTSGTVATSVSSLSLAQQAHRPLTEYPISSTLDTARADRQAGDKTTRASWTIGTGALSAEDMSKLNARQQVRAIAAARRAARNAREWALEAEKTAAQTAQLSLEGTASVVEEPAPMTPIADEKGGPAGPGESVRSIDDGDVAGSTLGVAAPSPGLGHAPSVAGVRPDWLVFFSPSGVKYALDTLRHQGWLPPARSTEGDARTTKSSTDTIEMRELPLKPTLHPAPSDSRPLDSTATASHSSGTPLAPLLYPRIATLGPTTARWIIEHLGHEGVRVDVIAAKPSPEELKEAICAFEAGEGGEDASWTVEAHGLTHVVPGAAVLGVGEAGASPVLDDD